MKQTPLLMRGDMVRATLYDEDPKTETRRLSGLDEINQDPDNWELQWVGEYTIPAKTKRGRDFRYFGCDFLEKDGMKSIPIRSPYGRPGDQIWIKETWRPHAWNEAEPMNIQFRADMKTMDDRSKEIPSSILTYPDWFENEWIKISDECDAAGLKTDDAGQYIFPEGQPSPIKWRPSIFMPRWCSRIDLKILDVRVERLKDLTDAGAWAEGIRWLNPGPLYDPKREYFNLWDQINGKKAPSIKNPWLWVLRYERIPNAH